MSNDRFGYARKGNLIAIDSRFRRLLTPRCEFNFIGSAGFIFRFYLIDSHFDSACDLSFCFHEFFKYHMKEIYARDRADFRLPCHFMPVFNWQLTFRKQRSREKIFFSKDKFNWQIGSAASHAS